MTFLNSSFETRSGRLPREDSRLTLAGDRELRGADISVWKLSQVLDYGFSVKVIAMKLISALGMLLCMYGTSLAGIDATRLRNETGKSLSYKAIAACVPTTTHPAVSHATAPGYAFKHVMISTESAPGKTVVVRVVD